MASSGEERLRVYVDADVLFAGVASGNPSSASQIILTLSELTLIDGVTSDLAVTEARRNLARKMPSTTEGFRQLVVAALSIVESPEADTLVRNRGRAAWHDLPHLMAAVDAECSYLTTFNVSDYTPGHPEVEIARPGRLVRRIRSTILGLE